MSLGVLDRTYEIEIEVLVKQKAELKAELDAARAESNISDKLLKYSVIELANQSEMIDELRKEIATQAAMVEAMADRMVGIICPPGQCDEMNRDCKECIETYYHEQAEKKESEK